MLEKKNEIIFAKNYDIINFYSLFFDEKEVSLNLDSFMSPVRNKFLF
jgi:hypothetical protein